MFTFPGLRLTESLEESTMLNTDKTPKVIISASGMCDAGRIRHHLKYNLWRHDSTVVFVGFQGEGTLGRTLLEGAKSVKLFGEEIAVNAEIVNFKGLSSHADRNHLLAWAQAFDGPQAIFGAHGGREVAAYPRGRGRLFCTLGGYAPCHDQEAVVAAIGYDPERDLEQPADSVFCAHGAGYTVKWDQVKAHMHVDSGLRLNQPEEEARPSPSAPAPATYSGAQALDQELQAIYERTYGPVKRRDLFRPAPKPERSRSSEPEARRTIPPRQEGPEYLLVDGYNIIFAWEELQAVARDNLDAARQLLMDILCNYQGFKKCVVILVFDAYKVPRGREEVARYHNIYVVYTREAETADAYIEKATFEIGKKHRVKVATSDGAEQLIILGHGALRLSATAFRAEVEQVEGEISGILARNNRRDRARSLQHAMDQAKPRKKK